MNDFRVIVTGSRTFSDRASMLRELSRFPGAVVVHGGASGADRLAGEVASGLGMRVEVYPADWERHGRAAGPLRNQQMVDAGANVCIAFPAQGSIGTWDCIRRAKAAGIATKIVRDITEGR